MNVGENKDSGSNLHSFPNPSTGITNIEGYAAGESTSLQIFTIYGTEIYSEAINQKGNFQRQVDLSAYASGLYFIKITGDGSNDTKKIMLHTF
jgi:hypothetical protein